MRLHEITQLLTESRLDYIIKNYSSQVAIQFDIDHTFRDITVPYLNDHKPYHEAAYDWIEDLFDIDPSHNGMYTQWMIIQYIKGNFLYEDSGNLLDDLEYFHVNKRAFEQKDINQYTVDELYNAVKQIEDQENSALTNRQIKAQVKQGAEKVLDTDRVLVIHPKTMESAQYYGKGTRWCTSAINNNVFDNYNERGPLYIIIDKKTNEKFQIHFESYSIMDARDKPVGVKEFIKKYPQVYHTLKEKFCDAWPGDAMSRQELNKHAKENTEIVLKTESLILFKPLTAITVWYYSLGNQWPMGYNSSTHTTNRRYSVSYLRSGSLYMVITEYDNSTEEIYQHFQKPDRQYGSDYLLQFGGDGIIINGANKDIKVNEFIMDYPEIFDHLKEEFYVTYFEDFLSLQQIYSRVKKSINVILETEHVMVVKPKTKMEYFYYFLGTQWTLYEYLYTFEKEIYIIIDKFTKEKYKLSFDNSNGSLLDSKNESWSYHINEFLEKYPDIRNHFKEKFRENF